MNANSKSAFKTRILASVKKLKLDINNFLRSFHHANPIITWARAVEGIKNARLKRAFLHS
ncbi:MAG: hypothetical protein J0649_08185 [Methylococcales bacterium]|nr:hypothetical protein [Methylococcales bacterium]